MRKEPPEKSADRGKADVGADDHVAEEEPAVDDGLVQPARFLLHDVRIWRIEAKSCRW